MKVVMFERSRNDLSAIIGTCDCLRWPDQPLLDTRKEVRAVGYYDDNFFDNANKEPKVRECPGCGKSIAFQWTREGVRVWE